MRVRALMNFVTTAKGYETGTEYDLPAEAAARFIASGHMAAVEPEPEPEPTPKKTAAKKTAAKRAATPKAPPLETAVLED